MVHIDAEHQVISFGDVRIFRRVAVPQSGSAGEPMRPTSSLARAGSRKASALPQVVEALVERPNSENLLPTLSAVLM